MDLSPARLKTISAWTPWRDELAVSDRAVRDRMRFLFTPLKLPSLSPGGARAGLGPDGLAREGRGSADVDMRPDPRLDRPIASRLPDDIGEAAQMAHARAMGVDVPVEAPVLSAAGKMAGLGTFGPNSSSRKAKAAAAANDLAMSRAKVGMAGRKATAMQPAPVPAISDASGGRGITGKGVIRAAGAGFEMRVPKGPVAQDRERWKSGTMDRIAAASKGLSLANMDWGDHREAPPKTQPKRTWVGKQGDATECPDNCEEPCADLAVAPHAAVNKTAPLRELEKERVPSDVCPPLRMSAGILEAVLRCNAQLAVTAPLEVLKIWSKRLSLLGLTAPRVRIVLIKPTATARGTAEPVKASSCACSDCGCNGGSPGAVMKSVPAQISPRVSTPNRRAASPIVGMPRHASPPALLTRSSLRSLLNSSDVPRVLPRASAPRSARLRPRRKTRGSVQAGTPVQSAPAATKKDCGMMKLPTSAKEKTLPGRGLLSGPQGTARSATTLAFLNELRTQAPTDAEKATERTTVFIRRLHGTR